LFLIKKVVLSVAITEGNGGLAKVRVPEKDSMPLTNTKAASKAQTAHTPIVFLPSRVRIA
jgi:hypothetical protein